MIFKIAKNELRNLFYSPIAWFITLVFFIQCAVLFADTLYNQAIHNDLLVKTNPLYMKVLALNATGKLYHSVFVSIVRNLYLFIPLLTMGLINREIKNGSIKLLYSSPIQLRQIVIGKYLGLMIYNLLLLAIVGVLVVTGFFAISNLDYGVLLAGMLGFFLLMSTYSAIGLYMSSLTTYQIVAALGTFLILFSLSRIGGVLQEYDFMRDLTWALSIDGRLKHLMSGLIRTKDIVYYLSIVFLFLSFTMLKLQMTRKSKPWHWVIGTHLSALLLVVFVGYIGSRPQFVGYWDTTASNANTIPPATQAILQQMDDSPLKATLYCNILDRELIVPVGLPVLRNKYLDGMWDRYLRFKPDIQFEYEYYYDHNPHVNNATTGSPRGFPQFPGKDIKHIAQERAKLFRVNFSMFKSPEEMRKQIDLDPEGYSLVVHLKYKERSEFVRIQSGSSWPSDYAIGGALKRLVCENRPDIAYITGGLEREIYSLGKKEYADHTRNKLSNNSLMNLGFHVDSLHLLTQDISPSVSTIVLADPRRELSTVELMKLSTYLKEGRNMMILCEPDKQQVINPLLKELGVEMLNGQIVHPRFTESAEVVEGFPSSGYWLMKGPGSKEKQEEDNIPIFPTLFYRAGAFSYTTDTFQVVPLFQTAKDQAWLKVGKLVTDSIAPVFNELDGDVAGVFPLGLALTRDVNGRQQRVIVLGDADILSNEERSANLSTLPSLFMRWLHYNEFPIERGLIESKDMIKISAQSAKGLKLVYIYLLPLFILLTAILLLKRRNRK